MTTWSLIAFPLGGLIGWIGGYCYGLLVGVKETEQRWSDAVARADHDRKRTEEAPRVR